MSNPNYPASSQPQPGDGSSGYPPPPGGATPPPSGPGSAPDAYGNSTSQPQDSGSYGTPEQSGYGTPDQSAYGAGDQAAYGEPAAPGYGAADQSGYGFTSGQGGYPPSPAGGYTSPTGYQPDPQETKSGSGALAAIIAGIVGIALGLGGGFLIWGGSTDEEKPTATSSPSQSEEPNEDPTTGDETPDPDPAEPSDDPGEPDTPDAPAPGAGEGTRDNPLPIGTEVTMGDWKVKLDTPKDGTKIIADENQFNDPPQDGLEFYIIPTSATYLGNESAYVWSDVTVKFVGDDGRTYSGYCGVFPDSITDVDELYNGGVAEGNLCAEVPKGAKGLWTVAVYGEDTLFFSAN